MMRFKQTAFCMAVLVILLSMLPIRATERQCPDLDKSELKHIKQLLSYTSKPLGPKQIKKVERFAQSECLPLKLLSHTLLYKNEPEKHAETFAEIFAIHDYVLRFTGSYNMITSEEMRARVAQCEGMVKGNKGIILDLLISYCLFMETNEWYMANNQRLSCARFFRAAYLTSVLEINAAPLLNAIDRMTEKKDLLEFNKGDKLIDHIDHLLQSGEDLNKGLPKGFTLLHFAADAGNKRAVIKLLELGQDPDRTSNDGLKPLDMAKESGHQEIVGILESSQKPGTVIPLKED